MNVIIRGKMPTLKNLAIREEVLESLALANSLVTRKNIRLTTAAMLMAAVKPMTITVDTVVMVLVVTVTINISPLLNVGYLP